MSQHAANASPAPSAGPLIAPMTGTAQSVIAHIASRDGRAGSITRPAGGSADGLPVRLQVDAGDERAVSRRGEDRDAHVPVVAEGREGVGDLGVRRVVDRVHGRTVERDRRDVIRDLDAKAARGFGRSPRGMYSARYSATR